MVCFSKEKFDHHTEKEVLLFQYQKVIILNGAILQVKSGPPTWKMPGLEKRGSGKILTEKSCVCSNENMAIILKKKYCFSIKM